MRRVKGLSLNYVFRTAPFCPLKQDLSHFESSTKAGPLLKQVYLFIYIICCILKINSLVKTKKEPLETLISRRLQRALEVAACQWHAFSNDRSEAQIEPVRVRPGLEQKIRQCICTVLFFISVRQRIRTPDLLVRSQTLYPAELNAHPCEVLISCPSQQ